MEVKQIANFINSVIDDSITPVEEGLGNIVDVGSEILDNTSLDNYVKKLTNQIGKTIFSTRPYTGGAPSVLMDSWEYGSILQKIDCDIPQVAENDSWQLVNGTDYSPNTFYKPDVSTKFFNKKVTFEVPISITERQIRESFLSATQLNAFLSMITTTVQNAMTINLDNLIMRTINSMTAETLASENFLNDTDKATISGAKAVNLTVMSRLPFTKEQTDIAWQLRTSDFVKDAVFTIALTLDRLSKVSTLFNVGGKRKFTPREDLKFVMLSDFRAACDVYLNASIMHDNYVTLPPADIVPYWQGSGVGYDLHTVSTIKVKTRDNKSVNKSGILAVAFDKYALGITNLDSRVQTQFNPKGEFYNNFFKFDVGLFNDLNENFVVFFANDIPDESTDDPTP